MDDMIKKLRILAIQEDENREMALRYLRVIENEIANALYFLYGKSASRSHSKLTVNADEGLIFIYDFSDEPDKEAFVFDVGADFNREYERLADVKGKRFWSAIPVVIDWIPKVITEVMEQQKINTKIVSQLEKLTATVNENSPKE